MFKGEDISVVIPSYNGSVFLSRCLASVANQTVAPLETLVVDDGSVDNTTQVCGNYNVRVFKHERNLGLAAARNTGIIQSKGRIIAFFDVDTELPQDYIEYLLRDLNTYPEYSGFGGREVPMVTDTLPNKYRSTYMIQSFPDAVPVQRQVLYGLAMAFKREVFKSIGLFDTYFRTNGEDMDAGLRITNYGMKLLYDPYLRVSHYRTDNFRSVMRASYKYAFFGRMAYLKNRPPRKWGIATINSSLRGKPSLLLMRAMGWTIVTMAQVIAIIFFRLGRGPDGKQQLPYPDQ
ncbi:MAG: glycosyltransferase family 2 protein [Thermoplasmataceae archaeon]